MLRAGTLSAADIARVTGTDVPMHLTPHKGEIRSPGQLLRHYAPRNGLRLSTDNPQPNEALLAFGRDIPTGFAIVLNLSERGDLREAAANLFRHLHTLEDHPIATMLLPEEGLGIAINDRLRRAAEPARSGHINNRLTC
jgi:L-threonylcarbamoyladenylate synthase